MHALLATLAVLLAGPPSDRGIAVPIRLERAVERALERSSQDSAATATLSGVAMPTTRQAAGASLVLNGMALRKKAIFKVYVAALYLPAKSADADAVLAADAPRLLVMRFVRDVERKKICEAWNEGLAANTPGADPRLRQQFATLCGYMEDMQNGEQMAFTYAPGEGTTVEVKGRLKGSLTGKDFADALFKCWIGPRPGPGEDFKRDLLGG
ncbi:MAG TPA: chalcone isomerase family protein [Gemmatimonadota bacterium]|jgi:hypothetical protein